MSSFSKYIIIFFILVPIIIINLYNFESTFVGIIFGLLYLFLLSQILNEKLFLGLPKIFGFSLSFLIITAFLSSSATLIYYIGKLDIGVVSLSIILLPLILLFANKYFFKKETAPQAAHLSVKKEKISYLAFILIIVYLILTAINFFLLFSNQTTQSIRSPWEVLPTQFFIIYFFSTLILIALIFYNKRASLSLLFVIIHYLLSLSVAAIIYKIGYGFDPFIHIAAEKVIFATGVITPKTFYYIGQYSLVVFFSHLFQVPIEFIDRSLLIIFVAIFIPSTIYFVFNSINFFHDKKKNVFLSLLFLIIPFSIFISPTPQGLANFFILIIIFLSLLNILETENKIPYWVLILFAIATLCIHPLTGIPAFIFIILLIYLSKLQNSQVSSFWKKSFFAEIIIISCLSLPIIFLATSYLSGQLNTSVNTQILSEPTSIYHIFNLPKINWPQKFNLIYDLTYFWGSNYLLFFLLFSIAGIILFYKNKNYLLLKINLITFVVLVINFFLLKVLILFPSLIEYEQLNYANRVFEISLYFLLPFFFAAIYDLLSKGRQSTFLIKLSGLIFISFLLTVSLFFSYPRHNKYEIGHSYSVSESDIKAVQLIENSSKTDHIVLANQTIGAAALKELGFKKYFNNDSLYFYSIPTGAAHYKIYLKMVYEEASKKTAQEAADLVGVKEVYFVINDYWTDFKNIKEQALFDANEWYSIDNGKIYVFKYIF